MDKYKLDFDGDRISREIFDILHRRLQRCAILITSRWKELLSVEGTGVGPGGKLQYGANPSRPGEPPHVQTGRLRASAAWEVVGLVARVGTNLLYGLVLELGGGRVKARPSLRVAVKQVMAQVQSILSAPMKGP